MSFNKLSFITAVMSITSFTFFPSPTYSQNFIGTWEAKIEVSQYEKCQLWYEFYLDGSYFMYTNCSDNNVEEAVGRWRFNGNQLILDWGVMNHYQTISDFLWKSSNSFLLKITYHPNPYYIGKERVFNAKTPPPPPPPPPICNACIGTGKIRCTFHEFNDFNKCLRCSNKGYTPCTACGGDGYHD